jgi:hypothetical protein
VREQIVYELRPLAVSAVGSDTASRAELEDSIQKITNRLSGSNSDALRALAANFARNRSEILESLQFVRSALREMLEREYREITVFGNGLQPAEVAKELADGMPCPQSCRNIRIYVLYTARANS